VEVETILAISGARPGRWDRVLADTAYDGEHNHVLHRQHWRTESLILRNKRVLGVTLRAGLARTQKLACLLRVLTHNRMRLKRSAELFNGRLGILSLINWNWRRQRATQGEYGDLECR
jgi:hypothetical protein